MRLPWLEEREEGLARKLALLPLDAAALAYAAGAGVHRALYERGWREPRRLPCRVVSVGSLVVGGTGKTPVAAWVAGELERRGHRVALASRGYAGGQRNGVAVVSDGRFVRGDLATAGDEAWLLAAHAPRVPVLVGPDRGVVGLRAIASFGTEVLVLDDGFQHHRLVRDVHIVTLDGPFGLGNGRVLPRGPLRERVGALSRADAVGVLDGPLPEADTRRVARHAARALRFRARRRPISLRSLAGGVALPPASLEDMEVGLLAGLARPAAFRRSVEALGARVVSELFFRDHHRYRPRDLRSLASGAAVWITTEKDAVKLSPSWARGVDLRVLRMRAQVEEADALLDWLEARLRRRPVSP